MPKTIFPASELASESFTVNWCGEAVTFELAGKRIQRLDHKDGRRVGQLYVSHAEALRVFDNMRSAARNGTDL